MSIVIQCWGPIIHDLLFIEVNLLTQSRPGLHPALPGGLTAQSLSRSWPVPRSRPQSGPLAL